jgi:alkylation response protein AidB-like acyl-CoA dehydrogenase
MGGSAGVSQRAEVDNIGEPEVSAEEMVRRAAELVPVLQQRAQRAEQERRIPHETVEDIREAGLLRIATPECFGGNGCDYHVSFDVAMELGRGCGSTAWCFSVWASHNWMVGQWPLAGQEEYFAEGPSTFASSSFMPGGTLGSVKGGYRLSGRWEFSSGSNAATWVLLGAMGPQGLVMVIVPRADFKVIDTWFTSGLRGTGSNDIVVDDAFVPVHRIGPYPFGPNQTTGWEVHKRPSYRAPTAVLLPWTLSAPLVGMAQGAVENFIHRATGGSTPGRRADSPGMQLRVAESSAEVDAARLVLRHDAAEVVKRGAIGEPFTDREATTIRRDICFVAMLAVRAVNRLFDASGGHALYDWDPMQRFHRDVHAGSHQTALFWDPAAMAYGRHVFGLPPEPGLF